MIIRYTDPRIEEAWSLRIKYNLWQAVELAVIEAKEKFERIPQGTYRQMERILVNNPIDPAFIDKKEKELRHDLNAFLEERMRFLPENLQIYFHQQMTSYDTEEAGFATTLQNSCEFVFNDAHELLASLKALALKYRHTPMNARTHGQEAEMQSFGKRCLTWYRDLHTATGTLNKAMENLKYSKLSGAIGTNSGIDPTLETEALAILGLIPWAGATQIMPRVLYSPIASALADIATVIEKIATDTRLGSRSGRPLWHEPFGKMQKGSSAMPHKKNNILGENTRGMAVMSRAYAGGIKENLLTWEERDIAQSSVERVFWPDLFHVTLRAIQNMKKIADGLVVYTDTMMVEIIESRGTYASNAAKELLLHIGGQYGLKREDAYRIVQLACFNAFAPEEEVLSIRNDTLDSLPKADTVLERLKEMDCAGLNGILSIKSIIRLGDLKVHPSLAADEKTVDAWNEKLDEIFDQENLEEQSAWEKLFLPSTILANEDHLFEQVFGK